MHYSAETDLGGMCVVEDRDDIDFGLQIADYGLSTADFNPQSAIRNPKFARPLRVMFMQTDMRVGGAETVTADIIRRLDRERFLPELAA
jgi:hypothetical protein